MQDLKLGSILLLDDDPGSNFLNGTIIKRIGLKAHVQVASTGKMRLTIFLEREFSKGLAMINPI